MCWRGELDSLVANIREDDAYDNIVPKIPFNA